MIVLFFALACSRNGATDPEDSAADTAGDTDTADTGAAAIAVGELVVTEVMYDPAAVDGDFGEYVELYNASGRTLDLAGLTLEDDDGDGMTVSGSLSVAANAYVVFGASANTAANGGFDADYAWEAGSVKLGNEGDSAIVSLGGTVIDEVTWLEETSPGGEGEAIGLDPRKLDAGSNDSMDNWCGQDSTFGDGDEGTPGAANDACGD